MPGSEGKGEATLVDGLQSGSWGTPANGRETLERYGGMCYIRWTKELRRSGSGHLLQQIHGKDPYIQVEECIKVGLGDPNYRLTKVN